MLKKLLVSLQVTAIVLSGVAVSVQAQTDLPPHVAGKVVAVTHEKVKVNETWHDQIKVKVESCTKNGALEEVHYTPASVSDRTALGHLLQQEYHHASTANMPKQKMINGFGLFWVDSTNRVTRTGLLGHNVDCRNVPALLGEFK